MVVLGGTNDLELCGAGRTLANVSFLLNSTKKTNLIMATIPSRHDKPEIYDKVNFLNDRIKEQSDSFDHCTLLPLDELPRHHYTTHGLHFGNMLILEDPSLQTV